MKDKEEILKVFSEIIPIKGYNRGAIYDLIRRDYDLVPLELIKILEENENKSIKNIFSNYELNHHSSIQEYLDFLKSKDYIFFCNQDEKDIFGKMPIYWDYPSTITNAIVRLNKFDLQILNDIISKIDVLNCADIFCIFDHPLNFNELNEYYNLFDKTGIKNIEFLVNDFSSCTLSDLEINTFVNSSSRISRILLNKSDIQISDNINNVRIEKIDVNIFVKNHEKYIYNFNLSIPFFMESKFFNTNFNRKIYFNHDIHISNSIENLEHFPYPMTLPDLINTIKSKEFQVLWNVKKDICDICKHCEFRYMCQDSRIPKSRNKSDWYFETECNYNPYISKWSDEDGYKTLAECGVTSNENGFSIDHDKIAEINKELWEE
jgi:SPASM domain peptide maturase of grasp-with-spasm system